MFTATSTIIDVTVIFPIMYSTNRTASNIVESSTTTVNATTADENSKLLSNAYTVCMYKAVVWGKFVIKTLLEVHSYDVTKIS